MICKAPPSRCGMRACSWTRLFQDTRSDSSASATWAGRWRVICTRRVREVVVWNRSDAPAEAAVAHGHEARGDAAGTGARDRRRRDLHQPDDDRCGGEGRVSARAVSSKDCSPGAMIIDFGTTGVPETKEFAKRDHVGRCTSVRRTSRRGSGRPHHHGGRHRCGISARAADSAGRGQAHHASRSRGLRDR